MKPRALNIVWLLIFALLAIVGIPHQASALISSSVNKANTTALAVPDNGSWVFSTINITGAPSNAKITGMDVHFSATHPRSSDLDIQVASALTSGVYHIWANEGGTAPNPSKTVTGITMFNGLSVNGNWGLYLRDTVSGNSGSLVEWYITIYYTSENGTGYVTYSTDSSILTPLIVGTDDNGDGYMETFQFLIRNDYKAPDGIRVAPKIISNATGQAWSTGYTNLSNSYDLLYLDDTWFTLTNNTDLSFTIELWNSTRTTKLATNQVNAGPVKAGVYFYVYGGDTWTPGTDVNGDGYYDTYNFQIGAYGETSGGPVDVTAKVICTTTGQSWWASAPWSITGYTSEWHLFDFSEADFAGQLGGNTTLEFVVELWDATKTTKLATAPAFDTSMIKVTGNSCSVAVSNFTASNTSIDPYSGGFTNLTADVTATPSATWRLNINGEDVASGNTTTVAQPWYGKTLLGQILEPGTYTATLSASDPSGQCTDSKPVTINITKKADSPTSCMLRANTGSSTSVATGDVAHSQELFSLKGAALSTSVELFYNSLNPYSGPLGPGWSHTYDISLTENPDGSVLLREGNGGKSLYTRSGSNYISPAGDFSTLVKNGDGTYLITYRDGHKSNFRTDGKVASILDRFNNATTFTYPNGDLDTVTDPAQRVTKFIYDTSVTPHRITSIIDPNLKSYDFTYQGTNCSNRVCRVTNPIADPAINQIRGYWEYQYDAQGFLKSKLDPQSNLTQYNYYPDHRLQSAIDPEGVSNPANHTRSIVYPTVTGNLRTTTITEKDGGQWLYTYDAMAGVLKQKTAQNTTTNTITTTYTYTPSGYLRSKTEPKDGTVRLTTFYSYDSYGNLLTQTDPVDLSTYTPAIDPEIVTDTALANLNPPIKPAFRYAYDYANYDQIASISNERSTPFATTTYNYSEAGGYKVTTGTDPDTHITTYRYNSNGTLKDITDGNNKAVSFDYKLNTLLNTFTDLNGVITTFSSYDTNGNVLQLKVKDTNNKELSSSFAVDALNRLTKVTKFTAAFPDNITKFAYDLNGNRTSVIDAEIHETKYEYRYDGQVTKITDAKLKDTILAYGPTSCPSCGGGMDKLSAIADAKTHTTNYYYDQLGRLEHETDPLNKSIRYTYYDSGLVKDKIDSSSVPEKTLITYTYDNLGRLTKRHYFDTSEETYGYDAKGNLQSATNQNISYTFDYYANGWLKTVKDGTGKILVSYDQYDGIGQRKQVTILKGDVTDQRQITYNYDNSTRLQTIVSPAGTFTFDYDYSGRRKKLTYPNQVVGDYVFDDLDRLTSLTHSVAGTSLVYGYTHDQVGNRKTRTGTSPQNYDYDEVSRLKQAVTAKGIENFTYDEVGNRQTGPGFKDTGFVYNAGNQLITGRKLTYTYDNYGNQTTRVIPNAPEKTWTQEWDFENRLKKAEFIKGAERKTVTFKYDPLGRRIEKKVVTVIDGVTKNSTFSYVYDNEDIVQETLTTDTTTTKTYFTHGPGIDEPLALERGGSFYYYHADGLGSITAITNTSKQVVQSYEYESFGLVRPSTTFANSYTFTGREWDSETGLMYYRGRTYDMREGRFLSKDPISFLGGSINLYAYVQNNPINFIDPTGLEFITPAEAQSLLTEFKTWVGTPYRTGGSKKGTKGGADCSHSTNQGYNNAGFPYDYSTTREFADNDMFRQSPGNTPQVGDVALWKGHMAVYAGNGQIYTAHRPGGASYSLEGLSDWKKYNKVPDPTWFRYYKPD